MSTVQGVDRFAWGGADHLVLQLWGDDLILCASDIVFGDGTEVVGQMYRLILRSESFPAVMGCIFQSYFGLEIVV